MLRINYMLLINRLGWYWVHERRSLHKVDAYLVLMSQLMKGLVFTYLYAISISGWLVCRITWCQQFRGKRVSVIYEVIVKILSAKTTYSLFKVMTKIRLIALSDISSQTYYLGIWNHTTLPFVTNFILSNDCYLWNKYLLCIHIKHSTLLLA